MGAEVACTCRYKGRSAVGKALLETDELLFRGEFRLRIPYKDVTKTTAAAGQLSVIFAGGRAIFELDERTAARWAKKINDPPTLMKKLGVKEDSAVSISQLDHADFVDELMEAAGDVGTRLRKNRDLIFVGAESKADLSKLGSLRTYLKPDGAIWVIRPKGRKDITENDVLSAGKDAGYVDVKVARFSDTHTAEKFVIPKDAR
jgi:hypothetical protein